MSTTILRYPLDLTGVNPDNFVGAEPHTLPNLQKRAFVPTYGPFFTESLKVYDVATGQELIKRQQYLAVQLLESATVRTGKEVAQVIVITDPSVSSEVAIDYQVLGGAFTLSIEALVEMVAGLDLDSRPVAWGDVLGRPSLFPPGHHLHDVGDVYGFEYIVLQLEYVRRAILMGDTASHDEIYAYIGNVRDQILAEMAEFTDHLSRVDNPHQTTKEQIGLGNVSNYLMATLAEAQAGTLTDRYMNPATTKAAVNVHGNRTDNPHGVTAQQVGTYTTSEINQLLNQRLPLNGTAVNSAKLEGYSYSQVYSNARANLPAANVTSGIFDIARIGNGAKAWNTILCGDNNFRSFQDMLNVHNVGSAPLGYQYSNSVTVNGTAWQGWYETARFGITTGKTGLMFVHYDANFGWSIATWGGGFRVRLVNSGPLAETEGSAHGEGYEHIGHSNSWIGTLAPNTYYEIAIDVWKDSRDHTLDINYRVTALGF